MVKTKNGQSMLQRKLVALLKRLSPKHEKYRQVESDLGKKRSGDYGESSIDYYLAQINGNPKYQTIKDVRLSLNNYHFQIDTLLLFPSFFIILETKHLTGTLLFDPDYHQLIQIKKEVESNEISRQDPILQVKMQYNQLKRWLLHYEVEGYPGYCFVVLTNQNAIVKVLSNPDLVQEYVYKNPALPFKIESIIANHQPNHSSSHSSQDIFSLISRNLVPKNEDILEDYNINPTEIITGVECPQCNRIAMERLPRRWMCLYCKHSSNDAHIQTLIDHSLLISPCITIREMCRFLYIDNVRSARKIIKELGLEKRGASVKTEYSLKNLFVT
ncbi:hypothetical protein AB685_11915 [Bacillus sp. LL01]|uniref:nuclease-related domain-containing protein n=1 Tax=Bacillus sp. LL01 TaxID=1665556 RepID=UPI00064CE1CB|nr:nuclease-related domain-containing protein [Bacillus sp. LL01]KMJ58576.1 hypothetical protein AB685_11915 [Bacillus sp. LL01]